MSSSPTKNKEKTTRMLLDEIKYFEPETVKNLTFGLNCGTPAELSYSEIAHFASLSLAKESLKQILDQNTFKTWTHHMHTSFSNQTINEEEFRWAMLEEDEREYSNPCVLTWAQGYAISLSISK
jgi:hypothetical protein